jgi:hypothetical protein
MDGSTPSISSSDLSSSDLDACLGTASAPVPLDVRREQAFSEDGGLIVGALKTSSVSTWGGQHRRTS